MGVSDPYPTDSYPNELLGLAREIANLDPPKPRQSCLRRAVSTAYYALFHLLIAEATSNWEQAHLRAALGRVFAHGKLKTAAGETRAAMDAALKNESLPIEERADSEHLRRVAHTFIEM